MRNLNRAPRLGLCLLLALGLAACGDQAADDAADADTAAVTAPLAQADSIASPADTTTAGDNVVQVYLEDYRIEMPETLPAGPTRFEVYNRSQQERHSFAVEGPGVEAALQAGISGDDVMQLRVELVPGTYRVYCPLDDHAARGMTLQLTVTPGNLAAATR